MDRGEAHGLVTRAPARERAQGFEITPELALVCPELAEAARSRLPELDPDLPWLEVPRSRLVNESSVLVPEPRPWQRVAVRPRLVAAIALASTSLLATGALTFAQITPSSESRPLPVAESALPTLVVPDLVGQPYVFAKQVLDDSGFAWEVEGPVEGYAGNVVQSQAPPPGTRLVGIERPRIVLSLDRTPEYEERGVPQNASRDAGVPIPALDPAAEPSPGDAQAGASEAEAGKSPDEAPRDGATGSDSADPSTAEPGVDESEDPAVNPTGTTNSSAGEESALERARFLASWVLEHSSATDQAVSYWLWQHSEIIDGARAGESGGVEALEILIEIDQTLQETWGVGAKSEALARETLLEIQF